MSRVPPNSSACGQPAPKASAPWGWGSKRRDKEPFRISTTLVDPNAERTVFLISCQIHLGLSKTNKTKHKIRPDSNFSSGLQRWSWTPSRPRKYGWRTRPRFLRLEPFSSLHPRAHFCVCVSQTRLCSPALSPAHRPLASLVTSSLSQCVPNSSVLSYLPGLLSARASTTLPIS